MWCSCARTPRGITLALSTTSRLAIDPQAVAQWFSDEFAGNGECRGTAGEPGSTYSPGEVGWYDSLETGSGFLSGRETHPGKRSLFVAQVALFDEIVAKKKRPYQRDRPHKARLCERAKKSLPKQIKVNVNTI